MPTFVRSTFKRVRFLSPVCPVYDGTCAIFESPQKLFSVSGQSKYPYPGTRVRVPHHLGTRRVLRNERMRGTVCTHRLCVHTAVLSACPRPHAVVARFRRLHAPVPPRATGAIRQHHNTTFAGSMPRSPLGTCSSSWLSFPVDHARHKLRMCACV